MPTYIYVPTNIKLHAAWCNFAICAVTVLLPIMLVGLVFSILLLPVFGNIYWSDCESVSDHWGISEGDFYNLCIIDHDFSDVQYSWNLFNATVSDVNFKDSIFVNAPLKPNNFTWATWTNVKFDQCYFGSIDPWEPDLVFDQTSFNNVQFSNTVFDHSVRLLFKEFAMWNVTFTNCTFRGDVMFSLGQMDTVSIIESNIRHTDYSTITNFNESFTFQKMSISGLTILDSTFVAPLRFESVDAKKISVNETHINRFACRSENEDEDEALLSSFSDTVFQTVQFDDKVVCDSTTWDSMFMLNISFLHDADFSRSSYTNIYWDEVESKSLTEECRTFNFSMSTIVGRVFANTSISCVADFKATTFEYVYVKSFRADRAIFTGAVFQNQEYIDGSCCSLACPSLGCYCNVSMPSGNCPSAAREYNLTAPLEKGACFPGDSFVTLANGESIMMRDLEVGMTVMTKEGKGSPVFMFGHKDEHSWSPVIEILTSSGSKIRLSPGHYLYVNGDLKTAENVIVGDTVVSGSGTPLVVTSVTSSFAQGMFAPTTLNGAMIVDDIMVSCYTDAVHPSIAHWMLSPIRFLYRAKLLRGFSWLERRSWSPLVRALRVPTGPDLIRSCYTHS